MKKTLITGLLMGLAFSTLYAENEIPEGDYFIRNNATGMFLKAGHDWGVMAAIGKHGKRFTYEKVGDEYKLNTNLSGDNMNEHWFRGDCWIDNGGTPLQISWVDEASHLARIKNIENNQELCQNFPWETDRGRFSDNYNDWNGQNRDYVFLWQILTKEDLLAELTAPSLFNTFPKDATFMIECWDFPRHDDGPATLWEGLFEEGQTPRDILDWGSNRSNYVGQKQGVADYDIHQSLSGLPNGIYQLRAQGFYKAGASEGVVAKLYAGNAETPLKSIADGSAPSNCEGAGNAFNNGEYKNAVTVEVTDGTLRIGIKASGADANAWCVFDNFELYYYGAETTIDDVEADAPVVPNGTYLLRNAETGTYISQGFDWGTQLAANAFNGLNIMTTYQGNGLYTLDSQVFENSSSHFLGTGGYVDGGATNFIIREVTEGRYFIGADNLEGRVLQDNADGRSGLQFIPLLSSPEIGQWELVTPEVIKAEMAEASATTPVNATPLVKGSNFGRHDKMVETWKGNFTVENQGDNHPNYVGQSSDANVDVYQILTDIPNGQYEVQAQAFTKNAAGVIYANEAEAEVPVITDEVGDTRAAAEAFNAGSYSVSLKVWVSDGTLRLGVRSAKNAESPWCVFDNFVLTYYGTDLVLEDGKAMPEIKADMEVASVSYDRNVEADRMISFILPVSVPAENLNGTAYELSSVKGEVLIFTAVTGSTAANKPYILVPSADDKMLKDMTETLLPATPASLSVMMSGVEFFGTYTTQTVSGVYGLSDGKFVGANTGTLNPYRAAISVDSSVKVYVISLDDNATGISSPEFSIDDKNYRVYNLSGQLLQKIQKGINIINGKKIIK
ncbi:MAG: hypothetical protein J6Y59_07615 [Bacteroidaceae bacterium]|nr:hypothetical protein [Bacteroidaceae bacterium]